MPTDRDFLLISMVDPNAQVRKEYLSHAIAKVASVKVRTLVLAWYLGLVGLAARQTHTKGLARPL